MDRHAPRSLPEPTVALVRAEGGIFDKENEDTELALTQLLQQFPLNSEKSHILLKVAAINSLYSTQIYAVRAVADRIAGLDIDAHLDGDPVELVNKIAPVEVSGKVRWNFSFASKYCSWHRPRHYAIYDSRAAACLWAYQLQFGLNFARKDLWEYTSFFAAVKEFQSRFRLQELTLKEIDKFLYNKGDALIAAREKSREADKQAPPRQGDELAPK